MQRFVIAVFGSWVHPSTMEAKNIIASGTRVLFLKESLYRMIYSHNQCSFKPFSTKEMVPDSEIILKIYIAAISFKYLSTL